MILLCVCLFFEMGIGIGMSEELDDEWNAFKRRFNKHYLDSDDELKHRKVFEKRLSRIKQMNETKLTKNVFGLTKFSDAFETELPALRSLGHKFVRQVKLNKTLKGEVSTNIPDNYWSCDSSNDYCGQGIDQGMCGSCYAAAIANDAQIRYNIIAKRLYLHNLDLKSLDLGYTKLDTPLSVQSLLDCGSLTGCAGGSSDSTIMKARFLFREEDYKYEVFNVSGNNKTECEMNIHECRMKDKQPFMRVEDLTYFSNLDWLTIKTLIYHKGSFITSMYASDDFLKYYAGGIWTCDADGSVVVNHAVVVDGYGEEVTGGALKKFLWVRNSWGDDWGINGHFKIDFDNSCGINDKIHLEDATEIDNFVPDYVIDEKIIEEIYDDVAKRDNILLVLLIIISVIVVAIIVLICISMIIAIAVSIKMCKKNKDPYSLSEEEELRRDITTIEML